MAQMLWGNSNIRVLDKPIHSQKCIVAGIMRIRDIIDENGRLLDYPAIQNKFGNCVSWLVYQNLAHRIHGNWLAMIRNYSPTDFPEITPNHIRLSQYKSVSSIVYDKMVRNADCLEPTLDRWNKLLAIQMDRDELLKLHKNIYLVTNCTKFRDYQFRLLSHNVYTYDDFFTGVW